MQNPYKRTGGVTVMPDPLTYAARKALRAVALLDSRAKPRGLGDVIEAAIKPIARMLQLPCLDTEGRLRPDSGCAKRRDTLNEAARLTRD